MVTWIIPLVFQAHVCAEDEEELKESAHRVKNKRKGNPSKLVKEGEDNEQSQQERTKRRGRPPKYLWGDTGSKAGMKAKAR